MQRVLAVRGAVLGALLSLMVAGAASATEVTDLAGLITESKTAITTNTYTVAAAGFGVLVILLGIGMLWRMMKKAVRSG